MTDAVVVPGPGFIGQAIARRFGAGKHLLLADVRNENAGAAKASFDAGFEVTAATVDVASRLAVEALVETATGLGTVTGLAHSFGVSPSQASPETMTEP